MFVIVIVMARPHQALRRGGGTARQLCLVSQLCRAVQLPCRVVRRFSGMSIRIHLLSVTTLGSPLTSRFQVFHINYNISRSNGQCSLTIKVRMLFSDVIPHHIQLLVDLNYGNEPFCKEYYSNNYYPSPFLLRPFAITKPWIFRFIRRPVSSSIEQTQP